MAVTIVGAVVTVVGAVGTIGGGGEQCWGAATICEACNYLLMQV